MAKTSRFRPYARLNDFSRGRDAKLLSPAPRRACVEDVTAELMGCERRACRVLDQHRFPQRKISKTADDEAVLTADITTLALSMAAIAIVV